LEVDFGGRFVVQGLVQPPVVVNLEIAAQRLPGFIIAGIVMQVNFLIFDRPPEPLGKNVVKAPASGIHADFDLGIFPQLTDVFKTGELAALVAVMYLRRGYLAGPAQRLNAEIRG